MRVCVCVCVCACESPVRVDGVVGPGTVESGFKHAYLVQHFPSVVVSFGSILLRAGGERPVVLEPPRALHPPGVLVVRVAPSLRVCGRVAARFGFLLLALLRLLRLLPGRLRLRLLGRLHLVPDVGPV